MEILKYYFQNIIFCSMKTDSQGGEGEPQPSTSSGKKKRHLLRRVMTSQSAQSIYRTTELMKFDKVGKTTPQPTPTSERKGMSLKSVRNLMRLGRYKTQSQQNRRDSSTEDEGR